MPDLKNVADSDGNQRQFGSLFALTGLMLVENLAQFNMFCWYLVPFLFIKSGAGDICG